MSPRVINVAVVHDNLLARLGLASLLDDCNDMAVRQQLTPIDAGLSRFDVIVADPRSGMAALNALPKQSIRGARVAIVAGSDREWPIRTSLEHGAAAYVVLGESGDEIIHAVRTVYRGGFHVSTCIAARLAESLFGQRLTAREEEVLALVSDGLCNKLIAARLDISVGTVKTHLRSAFDKLCVHSRTEAIATVQRRGLLLQREGTESGLLGRVALRPSTQALHA
jgi:DNA-binding NarL/FixJ family response regulator